MTTIVDSPPQTPSDEEFILGLDEFDRESPSAALTHFNRALKGKTQYSVYAHGYRGVCLYQTGHYLLSTWALNRALKDIRLVLEDDDFCSFLFWRSLAKAMLNFRTSARNDAVFGTTSPHANDAFQNWCAWLHHNCGDTSEAIARYERILERNADQFGACYGLGFILSTSPDHTYRDGARALDLAERAHASPHAMPYECFSLLAAAHAEMGQFTDAVRYAEQCLELAPPDDVPDRQKRLQLYESGLALHLTSKAIRRQWRRNVRRECKQRHS